jgi:tetratricopeptide (TPR) repeat protein
VAAVAASAFAPILGNGWLDQLDDQANFLQNPEFTGLGPATLGWSWSTRLLGVWQPLAWVLLQAQRSLFGPGAWGFHLASLVLHALVASSVYALVLELVALGTGDPGLRDRPMFHALCGVAASLYAAHPLRTEVVAWVSCQPYLPCTLFAVLAVLAYLRAAAGPGAAWGRPGWYAASVALFAASGLSKAVSMALPMVLLVLDAYPLRRLGRGRGPGAATALLEKLPFLAVSAVVAGMAVWARAGSLRSADVLGPAGRLAQAAFGLAFYPFRTLVPANLTALHVLPDPFDPSAPPFVLGALGALALVALGVASARTPRGRGLAAALAAYGLIVAPNLGLVGSNEFLAAERYAYASTIGLFAALGGGLVLAWRHGGAGVGAALGAAGAALVLGMLPLSWGLSATWRDSRALWERALAAGSGRDDAILANLAILRFEAGDLPGARAYLSEATRANPANVSARASLARVLLAEGRAAEAAEVAEQAVALGRRGPRRPEPGAPDPLTRAEVALGHARLVLGRPGSALGPLESAVRRLDPAIPRALPPADRALLAEARTLRGQALAGLGRDDEAEAEFAGAVRLDPASARARNALGLLLVRRGAFADALDQFAEAARLDPGMADAQLNLGGAHAKLGHLDDAERAYLRALELDPDNAAARRNLEVVRGRRRP